MIQSFETLFFRRESQEVEDWTRIRQVPPPVPPRAPPLPESNHTRFTQVQIEDHEVQIEDHEDSDDLRPHPIPRQRPPAFHHSPHVFPFRDTPSGNLSVGNEAVYFETAKVALLVADPERTRVSVQDEHIGVHVRTTMTTECEETNENARPNEYIPPPPPPPIGIRREIKEELR